MKIHVKSWKNIKFPISKCNVYFAEGNVYTAAPNRPRKGTVEARGTLRVSQKITGNRPGLPIIILGKSQNFTFEIFFGTQKSQNITSFFIPV